MKKALAHLLSSVTIITLVACSKGPTRHDQFDRDVDRRIQNALEKRGRVVQGNPIYSSLVRELEEGRKLLRSNQPREAFQRFDEILNNRRYQNFEEYSFARYYLAAAMYELGVDYGALLYFVDIVRKEPLRIHTHEALRRSIAIAQDLKDDELVLYLASSIDEKDKVPKSLRDEFRHFVAKAYYEKKDFTRAREHFSQIPHTNRLYLASKYILGTIAVQQRNFDDAIKHFRDISNNISKVEYYENRTIRQLANLALGRIFYETGKIPLAIVYYKKVEKDGDFYPSALYESAWALFKLNKFNESLAVLLSLNSPFYHQVHFLKSYLLRGAIYLELCLYEDAVKVLSNLENRFAGLGSEIDQFAKEARTPKQYYPIISGVKRDAEGVESFRYEEIFRLASANRDFLGVHKYILHLKNEREILKGLSSPRAKLLESIIGEKISELTDEASFLAGKKLLLTRQLIEDFKGLKDKVRYEIVSAERKILQTRALRLAPPVIGEQDLIKPEFTDSLRESLIWWDFTGEFWKDEIGTYLVDLPSRCKKKEGEVRDTSSAPAKP